MVQHNTIDHTGLTGVSTVSYASNANQVSSLNYGGAATTLSRGDHVHLGATSLSHTSNTFSGPVTLVAQGSVGITSPSSGTFAINAVAGGGGAGSSTPPNCYEAILTAPDALATANTFEDILSVTPVAGDYLVMISADIASVQITNHTIRIEHNGTIYRSVNTFSTAGNASSLCTMARVTANGTNAIKLQAASNRTGDSTVLDTANVNGTADKCTSIVALRITSV